ncbi:MAG: Fibronectin type III domain protein, partial [Candidatus Azambacteria bacterium GW2011_GWB1_42_17]
MKTLKFLIVFIVIISWIFSGWPQVWNNPPFPPKIQKAQAAGGLTYVGGNSATGNSASFSVDLTTLTGGISGSAAAGDLVIVADGWTGTTDGNPGVGTAGYTEEADLYADDVYDANFSVNWKTMGGTPDTSVSCNGSGSTTLGAVCMVQVWRNADSNTPMDVAVATVTIINGAKPDCDPITPITSGAIVICAVLATDDDDTLPTVNAPTGYVNLVSAQVDPGAAISGGMSSKAWTSGAEDPGALGNWDITNKNSSANVTLAIRPAATFIGNDTDPGVNPTIAPGAATTTVDTFNLKTNKGGAAETVTDLTATFSEGSATGTAAVLVTDSGNTTTYCATYSPSSATVNLTGCNLPVTTASTTFNLRIKPLTHSAMPAPPGGTFTVTATITSFTPATIDNASPNGATATSGTAGDAKVTLNWTASNSSSDFDTTNGSVILRWAAAGAGSEVPAEGKSDYVAGNTISTATVACVISSTASASLSKIDGSGGDTGCTTAVLTNGQQYTYVAFQRDTNGNYDAGASIGTFTPGASLTFTVDVPSVLFVGGLTPGTPVSTSSVLTVN